MKIYKVGGWVRDNLLNIKHTDKDWVVVGSTPDELKSQGYQQVGNDFPVFLHPDTKEEYALARKEKKTTIGHKGFKFEFSPEITLKDDLYRRDLTINAMAMDDKGTVIDYNNGQEDLKNKILQHVSPAFKEDPLRVLRVCRFSAQLPEFNIAKETMTMMKTMVNNQCLKELSNERVWAEIEKALNCSKPSNFIESMRKCGALEIILPEVHDEIGVLQHPKYHPEGDVYTHNKLAIDRICEITSNPIVRFAIIIHDVGKTVTPKELTDKLSHEDHAKRGLPIVRKICNRLNVPNKYKRFALRFAEHHSAPYSFKDMSAKNILDMLTAIGAYHKDGGKNNVKNYLDGCLADYRAGGGSLEKMAQFSILDSIKKCWEVSYQITGQQFIEQGHKEGPNIGRLVENKRIIEIQKVIDELGQ